LHESRFMLGFGLASLAVILGGTVRAVFGSRFVFLSSKFPAACYIVALLIWLSALIHPLPEARAVEAPSEGQLDDLKIQLHHLRSFVRKYWR